MGLEDRNFFKLCREGNVESVREVLRSEKVDNDYGLICACEYGHLEIVELLVNTGAEMSYFDQQGFLSAIRNYI
jgi:ankyrin repeat protein